MTYLKGLVCDLLTEEPGPSCLVLSAGSGPCIFQIPFQEHCLATGTLLKPLGFSSAAGNRDTGYLGLKQQGSDFCPTRSSGVDGPLLVGASAPGHPHRLRPPTSCPRATSWAKVCAHSPRSLLPHSSQQGVSRAVEQGTDGHQLSLKEVSQSLPQNTSASSHWPERSHVATTRLQ